MPKNHGKRRRSSFSSSVTASVATGVTMGLSSVTADMVRSIAGAVIRVAAQTAAPEWTTQDAPPPREIAPATEAGPFRDDQNPYKAAIAQRDEIIHMQNHKIKQLQRASRFVATVAISALLGFVFATVNYDDVVESDQRLLRDLILDLNAEVQYTRSSTTEQLQAMRDEWVREAVVVPAPAPTCAEERVPEDMLRLCQQFRGECERVCYGLGAERVRDSFLDGECLCSGINGLDLFTEHFHHAERIYTAEPMEVDVE